MVQELERRDAGQDGRTAGKSHQTGRFSSVTEQFFTRSCARCAGLLVHDWRNDLSHADETNAHALRCVQCGHRIDPVILLNQCQPVEENPRMRRARHKHSLRTITLA
jgi:hypothetical protein